VKVRPFEGTFAAGVLTSGFGALSLYVTSESRLVGMWLVLAAGVGIGWAWREASAKDRGEAQEQVFRSRRVG
jgi:hypothetical protein